MDTTVFGFDFAGDSLLHGELLPLRAGLTVVYGLNGAGKTRLLRGIRGALSGARSDVRVSLVVRAFAPSARSGNGYGPGWDERDGKPLVVALAETIADSDDYDTEIHSAFQSHPALSLSRAAELVERHIKSEASHEPDDVIAELLEDRLFVLHPTGTELAPAWDAWPVANPARPHTAERLKNLENMYREYTIVESLETLENSGNAFNEYSDAAGEFSLFRPEEVDLVTRAGDRITTTSSVPYSWEWNLTEPFAGMPVRGPLDLELDLLDSSPDPTASTLDYLGELSALVLNNNYLDDDEGFRPAKDLVSEFGLGFTSSRVDSFQSRPEISSSATEGRSARLQALIVFNEESTREIAAALRDHAQRFFEGALLDAPKLEIDLVHPALRFSRPALRWTFGRAYGAPGGIGLHELSRAEQAWATAAIGEALYWHRRDELFPPADPLRPALSLLDEPEAALHRSAESHMARALVEQARDPRRIVIAATHSPELLDAPDAQLVEVKREQGSMRRSLVHQLDLSDRRALGDLGLTPSDLLRWPRVFLLVEGEHDEVLLEAFLADRLGAARVQILPLRGGKKLPHTVDSRVLFDFTEAHIVGLVDNQRADTLASVWQEAQMAAASGSRDTAISIVVDGLGKDTEEAQFLAGWLTAALRKGLEGRVTPYGLEAKDVIEYLPVQSFVSDSESWDDLRAAHAAERTTPRKNAPADFKKWLVSRYDADLSPQKLAEIASTIGPIPQDFERLMKTLEARSLRG